MAYKRPLKPLSKNKRFRNLLIAGFTCVGLILVLSLIGERYLKKLARQNGVAYSHLDFSARGYLAIADLQWDISEISSGKLDTLYVSWYWGPFIHKKVFIKELLFAQGYATLSLPESSESSTKPDIEISQAQLHKFNLTYFSGSDSLEVDIENLHGLGLRAGEKYGLKSLQGNGLDIKYYPAPQIESVPKDSEVNIAELVSQLPDLGIMEIELNHSSFALIDTSGLLDISSIEVSLAKLQKSKDIRLGSLNVSAVLGDSLKAQTLIKDGKWLFDKSLISVDLLELDSDGIHMEGHNLTTTAQRDWLTTVQVQNTYCSFDALQSFYPDISSIINPSIPPDSLIHLSGGMTINEAGLSLDQFKFHLLEQTGAELNGIVAWDSPEGNISLNFKDFQSRRQDLLVLLAEESYDEFFDWPLEVFGSVELTGDVDHFEIHGALVTPHGDLDVSSYVEIVSDEDIFYEISLHSKRLKAYEIVDYIPLAIKQADLSLDIAGLYSDIEGRDTLRMDLTADQLLVEDQFLEHIDFQYFYNKDYDSLWANVNDSLLVADLQGAYYSGDTSKVLFSGSIGQLHPKSLVDTLPDWSIAGKYKGLYSYTDSPEFFGFEFSLMPDSIYSESYRISQLDPLKLSVKEQDEYYKIAGKANPHTEFGLNFQYPDNLQTEKGILASLRQFKDLDFNLNLAWDSLWTQRILGQNLQVEVGKLSLMSLDSSRQLDLDIGIQEAYYKAYQLAELNVDMSIYPSLISGNAGVGEFYGSGIHISDAQLIAQPNNDKVLYSLKVHDVNDLGSSQLSVLQTKDPQHTLFNFLEGDSLNFLGQSWIGGNHRGLMFDNNYRLLDGDLAISKEGQSIILESQGEDLFVLTLDSLEVGRIASLFLTDNQIDGSLSGSVNYEPSPTKLLWDLKLNTILIDSMTLGNWNTKGAFQDDILSGELNIAELGQGTHFEGEYVDEMLRFTGTAQSLPLDAFSESLLPEDYKLTGAVSAGISGKWDTSLKLDGWLFFPQTKIALPILQNELVLTNDSVVLHDQSLYFNNFRIEDANNRYLMIDGTAGLDKNLPVVDLRIQSEDFTVLDQDRSDWLEGNASADIDLFLKGRQTDLDITGNLTLNQGSYVKYYVQDDMDVTDPTQDIHFISFEETDSAGLAPPKPEIDLSIDVNLTLNRSDFEVILDPISREYVRFGAEGDLNLQKKDYGDPLLYGQLESSSGRAMISLPMVSSVNMDIKLIKLRWNGPYDNPVISFTGTEDFRSSVKEIPELSDRSDIIPVNLDIKLEEVRPSELQFTFDLNSSDIQLNNYLASANDEEIDNMATSLLLFGTLARGEKDGSNPALGVATTKLNELANRNLENTDLVFSMENRNTTNKQEIESEETRLRYNLRRNIYNNRLFISVGGDLGVYSSDPNVGVPSSHFIGNVNLDYQLFPSSTLTLKAAREERYQSIIDGDVTEYKLGLGYYKSYPTFKHMLGMQKETPEQKETTNP